MWWFSDQMNNVCKKKLRFLFLFLYLPLFLSSFKLIALFFLASGVVVSGEKSRSCFQNTFLPSLKRPPPDYYLKDFKTSNLVGSSVPGSYEIYGSHIYIVLQINMNRNIFLNFIFTRTLLIHSIMNYQFHLGWRRGNQAEQSSQSTFGYCHGKKGPH